MGVWEDWRNKKLQEAIDAGINPFLEFDIASLPSKGTAYNTIFPTGKVYGNIVDGIPLTDLKAKADGTVVYKTDEISKLTDIDTDLGTLNTSNDEIHSYEKDRHLFDQGMLFTRDTFTQTGITIFTAVVTLAGGAAANELLYSPGATKKWSCYWVEVFTDLPGAAGGQNYIIGFEEETSGESYGQIGIHSFNMPYKFAIASENSAYGNHATTVNKDLLVDIAGGDGIENVYFRLCMGESVI